MSLTSQDSAILSSGNSKPRQASGRHIGLSRDDVGKESGSSEFNSYVIHVKDASIDSSILQNFEEQYVSDSIFSGGLNSAPSSHLLERKVEPKIGYPKKGGVCSVLGCDGKLMRDKHDKHMLLPCECEFMICKDCFDDAVENGGVCPGCKEPYNAADMDELAADREWTARESKPSPSTVKSTEHALLRSLMEDDISNLFETKGTYGYGNAIWPRDEQGGKTPNLHESRCKPLTREVKISASILSAYRFLVFVRMVVLVFFLRWRMTHPNVDAYWLWIMSVICEFWFVFSWLLDQLPKLCPINRSADVNLLEKKFETSTSNNPKGKSNLPGIDVFVSTADPEKEPPLVTANTVLSILATDYPVEKLSCYVSDDGGALLTFEALALAADFAKLWVPFCREYDIEPRNPESYFNLKADPYKSKTGKNFVRDRRKIKREYDEFKVQINGLPDLIQRRSDAFNAKEEIKAMKIQKENRSDEIEESLKIPKATWMANGTHWSGTWIVPAPGHSRGDHSGIIQVLLKPPKSGQVQGAAIRVNSSIDLAEVDIRLPMLVYVSREKHPGFDHNKKAGAMNALVRASAIMSNGSFILNLDCDHYIYNSQAMREGMCYMMDCNGDCICYVQFPQRFEGIDPSDRYANHNTVFFDINMRALDGLQGPIYVGTGSLFRRMAIYGFDPPCYKNPTVVDEEEKLLPDENDGETMNHDLLSKRFGNSSSLIDSIEEAEFGGRPLVDHPSVNNGWQPGSLGNTTRMHLGPSRVLDAIHAIACWYEENTDWGKHIGWIYGSVTEDVLTGYMMHNRGWKSVYCMTKRGDAFHGTAPINLTDRLHQVLRWATGSVEIFFSRNNALLASPRMNLLQRVAYLNVAFYPFTSIFLIVYCFLPALSLFSGQFIVQASDISFLSYLLIITLTLCMLAMLEIKWSGIQLEELWRNEQFWVISGTSAHIAAVLQGLLKVIAGIEISFTLTSKSASDDSDDEFADLYTIKWTSLMIIPITIIMTNLIAIVVGVYRTIYSVIPQWSQLMGGVFFSFWVLAHLYPFAKGLMGKQRRIPTIVFLWSGIITMIISLLCAMISPPSYSNLFPII